MSEFNKEVFLQNLKEVNTVLKQIHICIDNIVALSNDMAGADSEINEAILQLQQNVITINGTLTTHGQDITAINNALANKMYKVIEVDDTATSGTFTDEEYSQIINDKSIVIKRGGGYFIRDFEETSQTNMIRFIHFNKLSVSSNVITAKSQYITVSMNNNGWGYTSDNDIKYYNKDYIDTYIQYKLSSGVNIKTINEESLLGSGNINISGGKYYLHRVYVSCANSKNYTVSFINKVETPYTFTEKNTFYDELERQFLYDAGGYLSTAYIGNFMDAQWNRIILLNMASTINRTNNTINFVSLSGTTTTQSDPYIMQGIVDRVIEL